MPTVGYANAFAADADGSADAAAPLKGGAGFWHMQFTPPPASTGGSAGVTMAAWIDKLSAWPDVAPEAMAFDQMGVLVSTLNAGGGGRVALYRDNGSFYPGDLIAESGELLAASTGFKSSVVSATTVLAKGERFWRVFWWAVGATLRGNPAASHPAYLGHPGTTSVDLSQCYESGASVYTLGVSSFTASHPTFPVGATLVAGRSGVPNIYLQKTT